MLPVHRYMFKLYDECFIGSKFVDWLVQYRSLTREEVTVTRQQKCSISETLCCSPLTNWSLYSDTKAPSHTASAGVLTHTGVETLVTQISPYQHLATPHKMGAAVWRRRAAGFPCVPPPAARESVPTRSGGQRFYNHGKIPCSSCMMCLMAWVLLIT